MTRSVLHLALLAALAPGLALAQSAPPATANSAPRAATVEQAQAQKIADLEARVAALEAALQQLAPSRATTADDGLEALAADDSGGAASASTATATPDDATAGLAAPEDAGGASGGGANAFNPAIAIILNGSLASHSLDPDAFVRSGFPLAGEAGPGAKGFSLGESEVSFAANIDDKFYGQLTMSVESEDGEDHLGVEEAFIDTTALPGGLSMRAGRFFSNIGYLNSHHAHTDSFFDRPLAYQAFLGGQYGDDGVQLRWVAPTSTFLEVGGEAFRGQNFPSGGAQQGGLGTRTAFAHMGGDVGSENEWLAGVSVLKTKTAGGEDGFSGDATVYVADGTWKWAPQGNFKDGGITLRGEYLVDDRDGLYADPEGAGSIVPWIGKRRGAYLEGVYRFNRTWDLGYRYDKLWAGNEASFAGLPFAGNGFDPDRNTAELTWRNSEFSLLRLQFSRERPNQDDTDNAVVLQYQVSLGAHGAHKF